MKDINKYILGIITRVDLWEDFDLHYDEILLYVCKIEDIEKLYKKYKNKVVIDKINNSQFFYKIYGVDTKTKNIELLYEPANAENEEYINDFLK